MQVKVFDGDTLIKEFSFNGSVDDLAARLEAVPVTLDAVDEHGTPIKVEVFVHPQWANSITSIIAKEAKEDKDEDEHLNRLLDLLDRLSEEAQEEKKPKSKRGSARGRRRKR